jgi:hypothetical protein
MWPTHAPPRPQPTGGASILGRAPAQAFIVSSTPAPTMLSWDPMSLIQAMNTLALDGGHSMQCYMDSGVSSHLMPDGSKLSQSLPIPPT